VSRIASGCAFAGDAALVSVIANPQGEAIQTVIFPVYFNYYNLFIFNQLKIRITGKCKNYFLKAPP
jgi:uncharacterized protein YqkB